jgi:hypothetical protein
VNFLTNPAAAKVLVNGLVTYFGNARVLGCTDGSVGRYTGPTLSVVHRGMGVDERAFNFFNSMMLNVMRKYGVSAIDVQTVLQLLNATKSEIVGL